MGRKSTGTVRRLRNESGHWQWHAKWTVGGERTDFKPLPPGIALDDEQAARACAARLAPRAAQLAGITGPTLETVERYAGRWLDDRAARVNSIRDDRSRMRDHVLRNLSPYPVLT